jgi:hypothetical protein
VLIERWHVKAALSAMTMKTDKHDDRGIAQLMRLGWFKPVHLKTLLAQDVRALLTVRKLPVEKQRDVDNSLRDTLRGFGLKVGRVGKAGFAGRIASWSPVRRCSRRGRANVAVSRGVAQAARPSVPPVSRWVGCAPSSHVAAATDHGRKDGNRPIRSAEAPNLSTPRKGRPSLSAEHPG